jgi:hypothetical protein
MKHVASIISVEPFLRIQPSASVTTCKFVPTSGCDQLGFGTFRREARRLRKTRQSTGPIASWRFAGRAMTGKLPGTRRHPILFVSRMTEGHAKRGEKGKWDGDGSCSVTLPSRQARW